MIFWLIFSILSTYPALGYCSTIISSHPKLICTGAVFQRFWRRKGRIGTTLSFYRYSRCGWYFTLRGQHVVKVKPKGRWLGHSFSRLIQLHFFLVQTNNEKKYWFCADFKYSRWKRLDVGQSGVNDAKLTWSSYLALSDLKAPSSSFCWEKNYRGAGY